jgi:methyltransferase (TIGR00027 family)
VREGQSSRTAEYMALFRALESALPASRRLFEDPLARAFLGPRLALVARLARVPGIRRLVLAIADRRVPGSRSSGVARTRFIDDLLRSSLEEGVEQLVVLGAGFDARAYRLPELRALRVFEVDHPDTARVKREVLGRVLPVLPEQVRFVTTDFRRGGLEEAMGAAGYRDSARTVFVWEGVTNYLTEDAVDETLRWCARAAPGSLLVFTYVHRAVLEDPASFAGTRSLFANLERFGERWSFGLDPAEVPDFLARRGLALERDLGAAEYRRLYFGERARRMRGYEFYRIAVARVGIAAA